MARPRPRINAYLIHWRAHTHTHTYIYIYICLLLLISMLWHRQAIFESKGDKLSSSAESRIRTHQGLRHHFGIASRLNAHWQTDWAIEDQVKNLNSTARPYDQQAFSPLDPTAVLHSHLALAIYMFVVVNFDALAQDTHIYHTHTHTHTHTYTHAHTYTYNMTLGGDELNVDVISPKCCPHYCLFLYLISPFYVNNMTHLAWGTVSHALLHHIHINKQSNYHQFTSSLKAVSQATCSLLRLPPGSS